MERTAVKLVITQARLRRYEEVSALIDKAEAEVSALKRKYSYAKLEEALKADLGTGGGIEPGPLTAYLQDGRVCPSWKSICTTLWQEQGKAPGVEERKVFDLTTPSKKVVVCRAKLISAEGKEVESE
jgi:hypothetical protein